MEPALEAREMGRGVTGGESSWGGTEDTVSRVLSGSGPAQTAGAGTSTLSCVGEEEADEFSCLLDEDDGLSSTLRTRCANFREHTDSLMLPGNGDTCRRTHR